MVNFPRAIRAAGSLITLSTPSQNVRQEHHRATNDRYGVTILLSRVFAPDGHFLNELLQLSAGCDARFPVDYHRRVHRGAPVAKLVTSETFTDRPSLNEQPMSPTTI